VWKRKEFFEPFLFGEFWGYWGVFRIEVVE